MTQAIQILRKPWSAFVAAVLLVFRNLLALIGALILGLYINQWVYLGKEEDRIKEEFAPVITALERYHDDSGAYPDGLGLLVPKYASTIPFCPSKRQPEVLYGKRKDGQYMISCRVGYSLGSWEADYYSDTKTWE